MIAEFVSEGSGAGGMVRYATHDAPTPDDARPQSAGRVAWSWTLNLGGADPDDAPRLMQQTIAAAPELKRAAGVSTRGRKLKNAFHHLVLSWPPGQQPSQREALEAVRGVLEATGHSAHQAVVAFHTDKDHQHAHVILCAVDPQTGRAKPPKLPDCHAAQRWAADWERSHGGIVIEARVDRIAARDARADIAAGYEATGKSREAARRQAALVVPMPPTKLCGQKARPGPGRPALTDEERLEWREAYRTHADRRARCALAQRQKRRRKSLGRKVRAWFRPSEQPPPPDRRAVMIDQARRALPRLRAAQRHFAAAKDAARVDDDVSLETFRTISAAAAAVEQCLDRNAEIREGLVTERDRHERWKRDAQTRAWRASTTSTTSTNVNVEDVEDVDERRGPPRTSTTRTSTSPATRTSKSRPEPPKPSWKDTIQEQFGITGDTPAVPPKAPTPLRGVDHNDGPSRSGPSR